MPAAAINTAPSSAPGANAVSGPNPGVGVGASGAPGRTQAQGLPAIFEAMLATLVAADAAALADGATGPAGVAKAGGKLALGLLKAGSASDDAKGKDAAADADKTDSALPADPSQTALAASLAAPIVPAPPQAAASVAADDSAVEAADVQSPGGKAGAKDLPAFAVAHDADDEDFAQPANAQATDAAASAKVQLPAGQAAKAPPEAPITTTAKPAAVSAPTPTAPAADTTPQQALAPTQDPASAPAPAPQAPAAATQTVAAQTAPTTGKPADTPAAVTPPAKSAAPRSARIEANKAPSPGASSAGAGAAGANQAGLTPASESSAKLAEATQDLADALSKPAIDEDAQLPAPAAADAQASDQSLFTPVASDPTASPAAAPANLVHAAEAAVRGSPQTVANLAAQIIKKLDARSTEFDVQLHPAGLGKVDVRVAIGADGKMSAAMSFDSPQAAAELKSRASELQQALEQSGFDLSGGMSFDIANGGNQGGQPHQQQAESGAVFRGRAFQSALNTLDAAPAPQLIPQRSALSGVDIRI